VGPHQQRHLLALGQHGPNLESVNNLDVQQGG